MPKEGTVCVDAPPLRWKNASGGGFARCWRCRGKTSQPCLSGSVRSPATHMRRKLAALSNDRRTTDTTKPRTGSSEASPLLRSDEWTSSPL
jgi:hypothetical protein